ncbi:unnamed protein product, partial [Brenthis ino]
MMIDAYEIYGHDPTDKLDHLAHYQIEMMKIKRAPDQVLLIALDDTIDNMLTMYDNHNAIKNERVATYNSAAGGAVPSEFYLSQGNDKWRGPFIIPGDPGTGLSPIPPFIEQTTEAFHVSTESPGPEYANITYTLDGCWFMFPPNYGSIAGISYLDPLTVNEYRYTCSGAGNNKGLYWYPQWMGAPPHHPYPRSGDSPSDIVAGMPGPFYPHLEGQLPLDVQVPVINN